MRKVWLWVLAVSMMVGVLGAFWLVHAANHVKLANANNESYPLKIVSVSPQLSEDATEFRGAKVTLKNTADERCVAFAVSFVVTFSNSERREVKLQEDHVALGYAKPYSAADLIPANQIYTAETTGRVAAREPATFAGVEAHIDYVEMADGKTYGEDPDSVGEEFRVTRWSHAAGAQEASQHLRHQRA